MASTCVWRRPTGSHGLRAWTWWPQAAVGNYLGRVTKPRILEAVREGAGERAAQLIDHMKKGDMAKEAERLLTDSGWLPEPLRLAPIDGDQSGPDDQADTGEDTALPDFLTEGGEDEDTDEMRSSTPSPPNSADRAGRRRSSRASHPDLPHRPVPRSTA